MLCRAIWDNRCVHHAVTPTHAAAQTNDPGYVTLGETRLMFRTEMQPTAWVPELLPPALREEGAGPDSDHSLNEAVAGSGGGRGNANIAGSARL
jgi:hypothetical protein